LVLGALLLISVVLIALALHEAAHVIMAKALGVRVKRIGIGWRGPFIVRENAEPRANLCISIAGPVANIVLAILFWDVAPTFARINLVLGLSNLIPVQGSDGSRAWTAMRDLKIRPNVAASLD
jgi:stage IV sporulation protein FB